ncbi:hypothetical protein DV736_g4208, partial [Chaetothyriales sp. CBS 134916]
MPKSTGTAGRGGAANRPVAISKALSRLLRHAAQQDRVPIDSHGYVRLDQVLGWQRLRSMQPRVDAAEVVEAVRSSDKGRFGLKYTGKGKGTSSTLAVFCDGDDDDPMHFFIRATQGHSIPGVAAENLHTPLLLANKSEDEVLTTTTTIVHGTFYAGRH